jgi:GNAT superfamily N-acetyltransferase
MNLKFFLEPSLQKSNRIINFVNNNIQIGFIRFHIEYSQIIISYIFIFEEHRNKGFGTLVLQLFEKYILQKHKTIKDIVLIPEYFNGIEKNRLCLFYEKNGFRQESKGLPVYIKNFTF